MQRPARIRMVEDERLTHLGYAVVALAATGSEAIQQAPVHRPDLVPMDIRLQGPMDGIEAAAVIPYPP